MHILEVFVSSCFPLHLFLHLVMQKHILWEDPTICMIIVFVISVLFDILDSSSKCIYTVQSNSQITVQEPNLLKFFPGFTTA